MTSQVVGDLNNVNSAKTITFEEPFGETAFAFRGLEFSVGKVGSAMVQCVATRPTSAWHNLKMTNSATGGWVSFYPNNNNGFPNGWKANVFRGNTPNSGSVATDPSYTLNTLACGTVTSTDKVAPVQKLDNQHWSLRYVVNNFGNVCNLTGRRHRRRIDEQRLDDQIEALKTEFEALTRQKMVLETKQ